MLNDIIMKTHLFASIVTVAIQMYDVTWININVFCDIKMHLVHYFSTCVIISSAELFMQSYVGEKVDPTKNIAIVSFLDWDSSASQSKNAQSICILDHTQNTFFCLRKFLMWLADDQSSSITKSGIYYIKHMYIIQPFSTEVDWQEIWH